MNKFITFEGCDGCGKTTQARLLSEYLASINQVSVLTREPGGTKEAETIRNIIKDSQYSWDYKSELLLYMCARNEHLKNVIMPNILKNNFIICDRYLDSTVAYQGHHYRHDVDIIQSLYKFIAVNLMPALTIILDLDPVMSLKRIKARNNNYDKYDNMIIEDHIKVRNSFLNIAKEDFKRCVVIEADNSEANIHKKIISIVTERFLY